MERAVHSENGLLHAGGGVYDLERYRRIFVLGAGKAAGAMAQATEALLGSRISSGLIVVKEGSAVRLRSIEQAEASHPHPDRRGVEATKRILDMAESAGEDTLIICLLSGGASALLVQPAPGITLEEKQATSGLLLSAGAPIDALNTVRKHLSAVKGGRLARAAFPAAVLTLILSDVIGNRIDVIASGPTAPDPTSYADAWSVIEQFGIGNAVPPAVKAMIERGMKGGEPESVKDGDPALAGTRNVIIAGSGHALAAAQAWARESGYGVEVLTDELQGEARDAGDMLARAALGMQRSMKPGERRCLLAGGETVVTVRGNGSGGRNQELALAFALQVAGLPGISLLSAGTDGIDGPTDAAGAFVDGSTIPTARSIGLDGAEFLRRNDSYTFFRQLDGGPAAGCQFRTGPTGTNVMDLQIVLIEKP